MSARRREPLLTRSARDLGARRRRAVVLLGSSTLVLAPGLNAVAARGGYRHGGVPLCDGDAVDVVLGDVVGDLRGRLGLVAVTRPADALAALGWAGATNTDQSPGALSAVLRSWEERFGAVLVGVGFDTVTLAVQRPPRDRDEALPIAAELFAFCTDMVAQGTGSIESLAEELVGSDRWSFWWD